MSQLGFSAFYGSRVGFIAENRQEFGDQIADEVLGKLDPDAMKTKEGASFSSLPNELQERLFELYCSDLSSPLIVAQQRLDDALKQEVQLRFAPMPLKTTNFFGRFSTYGGNLSGPVSRGAAALMAYTKNGQFLCQLFPNFTAAKPTDADIFASGDTEEIKKLLQKTLPQPYRR